MNMSQKSAGCLADILVQLINNMLTPGLLTNSYLLIVLMISSIWSSNFSKTLYFHEHCQYASFLTVPRKLTSFSCSISLLNHRPCTHTQTHTHTFQRQAESVTLCRCLVNELQREALGSQSGSQQWRRKVCQMGKMDFFAGIRLLLFSYVLLNGILITLQTKEGEYLF